MDDGKLKYIIAEDLDPGDVDCVGSAGTLEGVINDAPNSALAVATAMAAALKHEIEDLAIRQAALQADLTTVQTEIIRILEASEIDSVKMNGFNFYVEEKESVKVPKTLEDKLALFEYLRSLGLFDEMVSMNSMTLNSFYKTMSEEALAKGILEFRMPGVEAPTSYKQLKMRKV